MPWTPRLKQNVSLPDTGGSESKTEVSGAVVSSQVLSGFADAAFSLRPPTASPCV